MHYEIGVFDPGRAGQINTVVRLHKITHADLNYILFSTSASFACTHREPDVPDLHPRAVDQSVLIIPHFWSSLNLASILNCLHNLARKYTISWSEKVRSKVRSHIRFSLLSTRITQLHFPWIRPPHQTSLTASPKSPISLILQSIQDPFTRSIRSSNIERLMTMI